MISSMSDATEFVQLNLDRPTRSHNAQRLILIPIKLDVSRNQRSSFIHQFGLIQIAI